MNLENMQFLTRKVTGRVTQITLLKYNEYQKLATRRVTDKVTTHQQVSNNSSTQLEEVKKLRSKEERREAPPGASLQGYVNTWREKPEWERKERAAEVAEGLKAFKLGYRVEEDLYGQIMGENKHGTIRRKSISEQAAERKRVGRLEKVGRQVGEILARFPDLPKVSSKTGTVEGRGDGADDRAV